MIHYLNVFATILTTEASNSPRFKGNGKGFQGPPGGYQGPPNQGYYQASPFPYVVRSLFQRISSYLADYYDEIAELSFIITKKKMKNNGQKLTQSDLQKKEIHLQSAQHWARLVQTLDKELEKHGYFYDHHMNQNLFLYP